MNAVGRQIKGLYFVTEDRGPGRSHADLARAALRGGARVVQFRDKRPDRAANERAARVVQEACRAAEALFIVNDDVELAIELAADAVHLGQSDLAEVERWRRYQANRRAAGAVAPLLGISATSLAEAEAALALGADHLGVGPIFATPSKADAAAPIGLDGLRRLRAAADVPLAAIGGITEANAVDVLSAGADAICVISAVSAALDPVAAARSLAALCAGE